MIPLKDQQQIVKQVHKLMQACSMPERAAGRFNEEQARSLLGSSANEIAQSTKVEPYNKPNMYYTRELATCVDLLYSLLNYAYLQRYDLATALIEKLDNDTRQPT